MPYLDEHEQKAQEILARARTTVPKASLWDRYKYYLLVFLGLFLVKFFYLMTR